MNDYNYLLEQSKKNKPIEKDIVLDFTVKVTISKESANDKLAFYSFPDLIKRISNDIRGYGSGLIEDMDVEVIKE